ncbi:hypothetical protein [Bacillus cereus group sp. Bce020]|uniref:hypothetical protein n=1 Tax=Bacillus cereus group sp. Bce020 TaxID=3445246 RepID=UPI003F69EC12
MTGDSSRWSWILSKSGSSPFSSDQLRFSRTKGAFYLSCGRFLDAKSWPLELDNV